MAKSNRVDADLISELWPQPGERWWEVWLPPRQVRDRRELMRYRMGLVQMQTMVKNRIHALLHRHGILHGMSDVFGKKGMVFLRQLAGKEDVTLREAGKRTLKGMLNLLLFLRKDIAAMTWEFRRQLRRDASADLWQSVPGIGCVLGYTIAAETGDLRRFKSSRQLKAYSLLAPMADDSGDESDAAPRGRHVGWIGRTTLKWAFIEAAHGAVRKSIRFRATFDRHTDGGKRDRNRGYIAVAAELCHIGMSCVKNGRSYSEERPVRTGAQKKSVMEQIREQTISDPESGQPEHPMAEIDGKKR